MTTQLPPTREMLRAFQDRDERYDGVFVTGVTTTRVFCRPTCTARKPHPAHVEFFPSPQAARRAGYRACKRCSPDHDVGRPPTWIQPLLDRLAAEPSRRWTDRELQTMGLEPSRVRRWFRRRYGMTFHAFARNARVGIAVRELRSGAPLTGIAFDHGYESLSGFRDAVTRLAGTSAGRARSQDLVTVTQLPTPLGAMLAAVRDEKLVMLEFTSAETLPVQIDGLRRQLRAVVAPGSTDVLTRAKTEISEYFAGSRTDFTLPTDQGGTAFQQRVWEALGSIPYGATRSYDTVAKTIGAAGSQRAVGRANAANRVAIVIPCHRVVRSDGRLSGYAGGVWRKRALLALEQASASSDQIIDPLWRAHHNG